MDPTATLEELLDAFRTLDRDAAIGRLETLLGWLGQRGALPRVPELASDGRYQGWTNHATWTVHLWLNNDEGTYLFCRRLAREAVAGAGDCERVDEGIWSVEEASRFLLADSLSVYLDELNPLKGPASMFGDLLASTQDDVDFDEIADAFLDGLAP